MNHKAHYREGSQDQYIKSVSRPGLVRSLIFVSRSHTVMALQVQPNECFFWPY